MATVTCTPAEANVGQNVVVNGEDFAQSTKVSVTVRAPSKLGTFESDITADAVGQIASTDTADQARGVLTSTGTVPAAADTVTVDTVVYTFRATVGATANEILIGANAAASLANLKAAINKATGSGTTYGSATVVHPTVRAGDVTATTLELIAKTGGTAGNSIATTETSLQLSFGGATLAGGAAATGAGSFRFAPSAPGLWVVTATDGTDTASVDLRVWAGA